MRIIVHISWVLVAYFLDDNLWMHPEMAHPEPTQNLRYAFELLLYMQAQGYAIPEWANHLVGRRDPILNPNLIQVPPEDDLPDN